MRIDATAKFEAFVIYEAIRQPGSGTLDPITVLLRDFGGSGQIIVECFGAAWSNWFGAIGQESLRQFLSGCDEYYLATKFASCTARHTTKREEEYLQDIARAVIAALKGGAA
jgi:hypothetical protein